MTDKINDVIAHIMAKRAAASVDDERQKVDQAHDADLRQQANDAATEAWADLKTRIDIFLVDLNTQLQAARIEVSFASGPGQNADLISEYEAWFSRGSQAVDHNMRTVFKAHMNGQIDIFIAAVGDRAPRATFEFRTKTMSDDNVADVFAKYLEVGTGLPASFQ